uniref:Uncharacterized protein n=1 Tax=Callorhinchus milii TaxID=7868 RepID=A0A4W3JPP0_CALMI
MYLNFVLPPSAEDEAALLSEILPRASVSPASSSVRLTPTQKPKAKDTSPNDMELMSTMMSRLTELEQRVRAQAREISSKNKEITVLEEKVKTLQQAKVDEPKRKHELEKYLQLQNQVWEMEKFLNDYGMTWVGDQGDENNNEDTTEEEEETNEIILSNGIWQPVLELILIISREEALGFSAVHPTAE